MEQRTEQERETTSPPRLCRREAAMVEETLGSRILKQTEIL